VSWSAFVTCDGINSPALLSHEFLAIGLLIGGFALLWYRLLLPSLPAMSTPERSSETVDV